MRVQREIDMNCNETSELQKLNFSWQRDRRWVFQGKSDGKGVLVWVWLDS